MINALNMKVLSSFFFGILFGITPVLSQSGVNQYDESGKRHGLWKKYYDNSEQLRYEGEFDHGKETGTFKYYCEECKEVPTITRTFNSQDNTALVKYFTIKGKLVSEGKMRDKDRIGEWIYYHEKSDAVMTREHYVNGKLHGEKITYYPNGKITEVLNYENGLMQGENRYYSYEGVLLKKLQYLDDQLQGEATYYDAHGNLVIEGFYKDGKKHGLWKYYKDGKVILEEIYPKPKKK
jgi:antitoxin component YwqK of YwqJK toxin-antitoxin module